MVYHFIRNEMSSTVEELNIFSGNCSPQNINNIAIMQYLYTFVKGFSRLDMVINDFFTCDRTFGVCIVIPKDYGDTIVKTPYSFNSKQINKK